MAKEVTSSLLYLNVKQNYKDKMKVTFKPLSATSTEALFGIL